MAKRASITIPQPPTPEANAKVAASFALRQRARTDLLWFCNEVLQYPDVCAHVHGPIIERLQKFEGGTDVLEEDGRIRYTPKVPLWENKGPRQRLFKDPRGHLKTTVITIAHTIQWIINYPDIRVLGSMATSDQIQKVGQEILFHFRFNERFRWLFPEFCPQANKAADWGSLEGFTIPCRRRKWLKEPTFSTCSVGKVIAGGHYDVIKHSDLVDKENIKTPAQIQSVVDHWKYMNPLKERGTSKDGEPNPGWEDVEGTAYDFWDLYAQIEAAEQKNPGTWQIFVRDAEVDPEKKLTLWPERFPWKELKAIETSIGPRIYSAQYRQRPIPEGSGLATLEQIKFVPRDKLAPYLQRLHLIVDLAGMENTQKGDFTAMSVVGFDRDGRMGVPYIYCGRPDVFQVIETVYAICQMFKISDVTFENAAHERVLRPFLTREQAKRGWLPPIIVVKRDNRESKKQRIKGLQPWFASGNIRFAEEIGCRMELIWQVTRFSDTSTYFDDILDTLADGMQARDGEVQLDMIPRGRAADPLGQLPFQLRERFIGFHPETHEPMWPSSQADDYAACCDAKTGL